MASLSLREVEDPERLLASLSDLDTEFADFLANDVLAHQPAPILSFLLQTAILDSFNVALCEAVIASEDPKWSARRCIDWLEQRNLFITSLDGHSEWYRYHQIFRSVLLERATAELGPDRVSALQHRAADWYAQHGLVDEAVLHALAAGDRELAARCIAQGLCDVLNHEDCPTLDRWLGLFAPEFIEERADLLIVRGFSLFLSWQLGALARARRTCCRSAGRRNQHDLTGSRTRNFARMRGGVVCGRGILQLLIQAVPKPMAAKP